MPGKLSKYSNVSLHTELIEAVREFIKSEKLGYRSSAEFIAESVRLRLESKKKLKK